jgi:hypothetical protein
MQVHNAYEHDNNTISFSLRHCNMTTESLVKDESNRIFLDSLPYVDTVHEDYEDYALALIEEEMKQFQPHGGRKVAPVRFRSTMMQQEFKSLVVENQFQPRKETSFQPRKITRPETEEEWVVGINDAKSRLESERIRGLLLEAEKEEAVESWKDYNMALQHHQMQWENALQRQKESVEEINYQRQQAQQNQLGPQLETLNLEYQQALYRRNQLEHAIEAHRRR